MRVGIWFLSFRSGVVKTPETTAFVQSTMSLSVWTLVVVILGLTLALGGVVGGSPSAGIIDVVLTFLKVPASSGVASRRLFFGLGLIGVDGREGEDVKGCSDEDGIWWDEGGGCRGDEGSWGSSWPSGALRNDQRLDS